MWEREELNLKIKSCKEWLTKLKQQKKKILGVLEWIKDSIRDNRESNWRKRYNHLKSIQHSSKATVSKPPVRSEWYSKDQMVSKLSLEQKLRKIDSECKTFQNELKDLEKEWAYLKNKTRITNIEEKNHDLAMKFAKKFDPDSLELDF